MGNQNFIKGEFQSANIHYLKTLAAKEGKFDQWIRYNLGNVYFALGEREGAVEQWLQASGSESTTLKFSTLFNTGIYYYEEGRYGEAYSSFKEALEIDPSQIDAKRNLELALEKMESQENTPEKETVSRQERRLPNKDYAERVLEYVKRKEEQQWFSVEDEKAGEQTVNDW
jgi:tetratricopeptide (TPR) repeat protein